MNAKERLLKELELATAPIPRSTLSVKLGVSDRYLRQIIRDARKDGWPICSSSNSNSYGYWMGNRSDVKRISRELEHRAMDMLETSRKMKRMQLNKQIEGQIEMEGIR